MVYIFLRVAAVPLFLIGYLLYQALVKKKKIVELQTDILYVTFFSAVYLGLYYFLTD
jgi:hypothetical protein